MAHSGGHQRQSRLLQPASRLSSFLQHHSAADRAGQSLAQRSAMSASSKLAGSNFHQNSLPTRHSHFGAPNSLASSSGGSNNMHYASNQSISSGLPVPSANTSGLPAPGSRLPSTVGSALRYQQTSGLGAPTASSQASNIAATAPATVSANSSQQATFGLRRSQSQRPPSSQFMRSSGIATPTSLAPAATASTQTKRFQQQQAATEAREEELEEEDENASPTRSVEVLPPLKSASYISRLASNSPQSNRTLGSQDRKYSSREQLSEPIRPLANRLTTSNELVHTYQPKPSQLVKPLMSIGQNPANDLIQKGRAGLRTTSKRSLSSSSSSRQFVSSSLAQTDQLPSAQLSSTNTSGVRASSSQQQSVRSKFVPTYSCSSSKSVAPVYSDHRSTGVSKAPNFGLLKSSARAGAAQGARSSTSTSKPVDFSESSRRFSLQQQVSSGYNSLTFQLQPAGSGEYSNTARGREAEQDEQEDEEDEDEEEEDEEEDEENDDEEEASDEDATTATTMTQMSDSNELADANRELNNMIQMLTSKEIMRESEQRGRSRKASRAGQPTECSSSSSNSCALDTPTSSTKRKLEPAQRQSRKVESSLVKSHSLSFHKSQREMYGSAGSGNHNQQERQQQQQVGATNEEFQCGSFDRRRRTSNQLSRPRSRIIFDPTSSQFHVSCLPNDANRSESSSTSSSYAELDNELDEASRKLITAQSEIIALKSLEQLKLGAQADSGRHDTDTIRRLKDCRGSLESLVTISSINTSNTPPSFQQSRPDGASSNEQDNLSVEDQDQSQSKRRSPVGLAISKLFGLNVANAASKAAAGGGGEQLATSCGSLEKRSRKTTASSIVRHASLRADPRPTMDSRVASVSRKISVPTDSNGGGGSGESQPEPMNVSSSPKSQSLGGDLLQRASKRLSASSSSITNKFKHMISASSGSSAAATNNSSVQQQNCAPNDNTAKQQQHSTKVSFQKNIGLPPRMPADQRLSINTSELTNSARQDNSSSGNSSNCSSQLNGMNNCDRPNSLDANSAADDKLSFNSNEDSGSTHATSVRVAATTCTGFGNLHGLADNDTDLTLLSETSTLQGDTGIAYYANRCAELDRTVASLKSKLIGKEKELTDLQLSQLNNDYTIERLKKQVGRLERENAQLKTIVASKG